MVPCTNSPTEVGGLSVSAYFNVLKLVHAIHFPFSFSTMSLYRLRPVG